MSAEHAEAAARLAFEKRDLTLLDHAVADAVVSTLPSLLGGDEEAVRRAASNLVVLSECFCDLPDWVTSDSANSTRATLCEGQIKGVLTLLRVYLSLATPRTARAALRRKNAVPILLALKKGDRTLAELAEKLGISLSQLGREVSALTQADLLASVKEGRERWVSLTSAGRRAAVQGNRNKAPHRARYASEELNRLLDEAMSEPAPREVATPERRESGMFRTSNPPSPPPRARISTPSAT